MEQLGIITKPQGLKGEFRVNTSYYDFTPIKGLKSVVINSISYDVEKVVLRDSFIVLKVKGIDTCEQAEDLRNTPIYCDLKMFLGKDEVLVKDVIGFDIFSKQANFKIGTLVSIEDYGKTEVYMAENNGKTFSFPNVRGVITKFDMQNKRIVVDEYVLNEIRVDD